MLRRYITLLLLFSGLSGFGQTNIQFIPELYGRNVDGLLRCTIVHIGGAQSATLTVVVKERKAGTVAVAKTGSFSILPGTGTVPFAVARGASVQFSSNNIGRLTSMNRNFPEGDYEYCYTLNFVSGDGLPVEQCFDYQLAPFASLNLIDPYDKDKICDQRPLLTWQPLLPGVPGAFYQLVLAEIKSGQNATEALNYNLPVINQSQIMSPVLPYPSIAPQLEKGKSYAWQVTAYKDQTVLNRTEIWSFKVDCQDTVKKIVDDGYRNIEDLLKGNYHLAVGVLKFAFVNPYGPQDLRYEVTSLNDPDKKIKGLPKVKIATGTNQVLVDLAADGHFKNGNYYILKIWLPNGAQKNLRFIYQQPNE